MPWASLEAVAARSYEIDGRLVADVSVRTVASELGVAKGTAARALGVLRDAGLVVSAQGRGDRGRFAAGCYVVMLPSNALAADTGPAPGQSRSPSATASLTNAALRVRRPRVANAASELSLFDAD
jgi:hypothetical protein